MNDDELDTTRPHPCERPGCRNTVLFDNEPYCFTHSPDSGSYRQGYSYWGGHSKQEGTDDD